MKRDMDLIRKILLKIESDQVIGREFVSEDLNESYHIALLIDAGFVAGHVDNGSANFPVKAHVSRLCWKGCELLDTIRDNMLWKISVICCQIRRSLARIRRMFDRLLPDGADDTRLLRYDSE